MVFWLNAPEWLADNIHTERWGLLIPLPEGGLKKPKAAKSPTKREEQLRKRLERAPSIKDRALAFVRERGVVSGADLQKIGVSRHYLSRMRALGILVRVGRMQYCVPDEIAA